MEIELAAPDSSDWSIDAVVRAYLLWLEVKAPDHMKAFSRRLKEDPEAAHAEAVTFNMLRMGGKNPEPGEILGEGGVDFICRPTENEPFAVEVTVLKTEAVTQASGLASPLPTDGGRGFSQITTRLMYEAVNKAPQMSGYEMPRILVIATTHDAAGLLMGAHAAEELLTGTTSFRVRVGDVQATPEIVATLKNSVFFRESDGAIEPARRSISAILLMGIRADRCHVIGVLHPDPVRPFNPAALDRVHFVRMREWPITARFGIEWVGPPPSPTSYPHLPVPLREADLKS